MRIKTVTTVDGINSVDFGDNASRFYWFKNLSDSTLHVSSNPNMIAGEDDVSELPPKSSTAIETTAGVVYVRLSFKNRINLIYSGCSDFILKWISRGV